ncbi:MAG: hypothetical protein LBI95_00055, partial [Holosporales bacterium]|nr:hypothetical protein [Holosporales bacterium]
YIVTLSSLKTSSILLKASCSFILLLFKRINVLYYTTSSTKLNAPDEGTQYCLRSDRSERK